MQKVTTLLYMLSAGIAVCSIVNGVKMTNNQLAFKKQNARTDLIDTLNAK